LIVIIRTNLASRIQTALKRSRIVALVGPRQCGKTTLARELLKPESPAYFDLEDPVSLARLEQPKTALESLRGLVVIDEVQRRPDLFPVLRVLADRQPLPAKFLILGSASLSCCDSPLSHSQVAWRSLRLADSPWLKSWRPSSLPIGLEVASHSAF
jgi:predicted AAA+ superfamily ATPase